MTQFQQSASVRTLDTSERAYPAPFLAIVAGLVAVLMTLAVISFAIDALPSDTAIIGNADTAAVDGYLAGLTAANKQHRLDAAQQLNDGWAGALVTQQTSTATDGWEAALIRPQEAATDGDIQRLPLQLDEAAADGNALRFPPQPAEAAVDRYNQRFVNAD